MWGLNLTLIYTHLEYSTRQSPADYTPLIVACSPHQHLQQKDAPAQSVASADACRCLVGEPCLPQHHIASLSASYLPPSNIEITQTILSSSSFLHAILSNSMHRPPSSHRYLCPLNLLEKASFFLLHGSAHGLIFFTSLFDESRKRLAFEAD